MNFYDLGKNIKYYRTDKHLSQAALAEKANLSAKYIGHLEGGFKTPSLKTLVKIANALEISSDLLLFELLDNSYCAKNCFLNNKISELSSEKQKLIYSVIDTMIKELEDV
ncbi:MAG: helix-turn-helix domain-containing protein [Eubacterium sp.]|nr:helix-turn-helix domain-containing protein [Eubacterium sp.]